LSVRKEKKKKRLKEKHFREDIPVFCKGLWLDKSKVHELNRHFLGRKDDDVCHHFPTSTLRNKKCKTSVICDSQAIAVKDGPENKKRRENKNKRVWSRLPRDSQLVSLLGVKQWCNLFNTVVWEEPKCDSFRWPPSLQSTHQKRVDTFMYYQCWSIRIYCV
jgi:hypothetical protein